MCASIARPRPARWIGTPRNSPICCLLPARPFDTSEVVYRTVDAEGFVVYRQNFYSAPWRLIGQPVAVRTTENELTIYDRAFVVAAVHPLLPRGDRGRAQPLLRTTSRPAMHSVEPNN